MVTIAKEEKMHHPPRLETVSLPYLHDWIILLSKQLFFLKSYQWSLNLKMSDKQAY